MLLSATIAVSLVGALAAYVYFVLDPARRGRRPISIALLGALSLPFLIPIDWVYGRCLLTAFSIILAIKALERHRGVIADRALWSNPIGFLFWLAFPPDARCPVSGAERKYNRLLGRRRLARALAKALGVGMLLALNERWPMIHGHLLLESQWSLWLTYFAISGIADVVSGLGMQSGIHLQEVFIAPFAARSPRDFWSRRWNRFVHRSAQRNLFAVAGGMHHPIRAITLIFLASGAVHEYLIIGCLGRLGEHTGFMMLFFAVHGLAVVAEFAAERAFGRGPWMPRWAGITAHLIWLTVTAPLFFLPLADVFTHP
jgi:hypothetical protein